MDGEILQIAIRNISADAEEVTMEGIRFIDIYATKGSSI